MYLQYLQHPPSPIPPIHPTSPIPPTSPKSIPLPQIHPPNPSLPPPSIYPTMKPMMWCATSVGNGVWSRMELT